MKEYEIHCEHACRNTCGMLSKAILLEANLTGFYEQLSKECDYPDVEALLVDLMDHHRRAVNSIGEKLTSLKARGQMLDGVMSSFDPAGC